MSTFGAIAILDALGVRNLSIGESSGFLTRRDVLLAHLEAYHALCEGAGLWDRFVESGVSAKPHTFLFGDTMLFAWECDLTDLTLEERMSLPSFSAITAMMYLMPITYWALKLGMLLRGAVSYGEFIVDSRGVLGPAVTDAAAWYEKADWFGIMTTPSTTGALAAAARAASVLDQVGAACLQYEVPLKGGAKHLAFASSWPYAVCLEPWFELGRTTPDEILNFYRFQVSHPRIPQNPEVIRQIPPGTESKYENAERFFAKVTADGVTTFSGFEQVRSGLNTYWEGSGSS